jgi:hypothetical protein
VGGGDRGKEEGGLRLWNLRFGTVEFFGFWDLTGRGMANGIISAGMGCLVLASPLGLLDGKGDPTTPLAHAAAI